MSVNTLESWFGSLLQPSPQLAGTDEASSEAKYTYGRCCQYCDPWYLVSIQGREEQGRMPVDG